MTQTDEEQSKLEKEVLRDLSWFFCGGDSPCHLITHINLNFSPEGSRLVKQSPSTMYNLLLEYPKYHHEVRRAKWHDIPLEEQKPIRDRARQEFCKSMDAEMLYQSWKSAVYRIPTSRQDFILKVKEAESGIYGTGCQGEMRALEYVRTNDLQFTAPQTYFSSEWFIAMEDLSRYPTYHQFVEQHPECKDELRTWLLGLNETSPYRLDFDAIEDQRPREAGAFILAHDPKESEMHKRYRVAVIDVGNF